MQEHRRARPAPVLSFAWWFALRILVRVLHAAQWLLRAIAPRTKTLLPVLSRRGGRLRVEFVPAPKRLRASNFGSGEPVAVWKGKHDSYVVHRVAYSEDAARVHLERIGRLLGAPGLPSVPAEMYMGVELLVVCSVATREPVACLYHPPTMEDKLELCLTSGRGRKDSLVPIGIAPTEVFDRICRFVGEDVAIAAGTDVSAGGPLDWWSGERPDY